MARRLYGIRGAVCCENTAEEIQSAVSEMCSRLFSENGLQGDDFVSLHFTMTSDLDALNPAAALRRSDCGDLVKEAALFCSAEAFVRGGLPRTIRLLVTAYMEEGSKPIHIYTGGAEVLRPDFVQASLSHSSTNQVNK